MLAVLAVISAICFLYTLFIQQITFSVMLKTVLMLIPFLLYMVDQKGGYLLYFTYTIEVFLSRCLLGTVLIKYGVIDYVPIPKNDPTIRIFASCLDLLFTIFLYLAANGWIYFNIASILKKAKNPKDITYRKFSHMTSFLSLLSAMTIVYIAVTHLLEFPEELIASTLCSIVLIVVVNASTKAVFIYERNKRVIELQNENEEFQIIDLNGNGGD